MMRLLRGALAFAGAAALLAVSATTAFAGGGYAGGSVKGESAGGGGALPFTGADVVLYAGIAAGVIVSGLALRSYSARRVD